MNYFFTEKSLEEEIYDYCIENGIPLIYGGLLLSYRHQRGGEMTKLQLECYLSDLNLSYYNEEELQEIYNAVKSTVDRIEERIGREE